MNRTQIYLDEEQTARLDERAAAEQEDLDQAAWQAQWRKALESSAGIAPYLGEGSAYVENIRRADPERLQFPTFEGLRAPIRCG